MPERVFRCSTHVRRALTAVTLHNSLQIAALRLAATSTDRLSFFCVRKPSANSALPTSSGDSTFVLSMSTKMSSSASM
jgi:hypothetical protein